MRIIIATAVYHPQINGVAVFSYNLATGLVTRGHEVAVICPSHNQRNYSETFEGVKVYYLKSTDIKVYPDQIHPTGKRKRLFYKHGLRVSIFPKREVNKILENFKPDVVHIQVSDPVGLSVGAYARKHGIPVVTTEHNQPDVITAQLKLGFMKKPVDVALTSYLLHQHKKSDFVTMPTKQAINSLILSRGKKFEAPIAAVSNGVDLSHFTPGEKPKKICDKYNVDPARPTALYVGRIDPEKKVGLVVEAFLKVAEKIENAQLVIVGDGTDLARLRKKYDFPNKVHFLGKIITPTLYDIYKMGDVFITASPVETQGIVLIEAAASGLPLIAVRAGAVPEICVDKVNGFLSESGNLSELSQALQCLLTDGKLRANFAQKSIEIAKEHDFQKTLDKFENIYRRVINDKD